MRTNPSTRFDTARAFTLIELLVVMTIIAVLAFAIFGGVNKTLLKARKITCLSVMKNAGDGLLNYAAENHGKNPAPKSKQPSTDPQNPGQPWDTIYGDGGTYKTNEWLIAVLLGIDGIFMIDKPESTKDANPTLTRYTEFDQKSGPKAGLYIDDKGVPRLYDPWGRDIIFAVNDTSQAELAQGGFDDKVLWTWGLTQYKDVNTDPENFIKPFAMMSFGADAAKGVEGKEGETSSFYDANRTFAGSDDVISW